MLSFTLTNTLIPLVEHLSFIVQNVKTRNTTNGGAQFRWQFTYNNEDSKQAIQPKM